ncbi:universal stress protein [Propioniciclava soli]|uniref:universal stress protein n=1 Tax=Propioniciclava soli TaxID=2775081 RepID=UPI001E419685|nr:universal stress protein [Propioniciclava soli]
MNILVWVVAGTWPACVGAAKDIAEVRHRAGQDVSITLLHVIDDAPHEVAAGAFDALMGRGRHRDPAEQIRQLTQEAAEDMLAAAHHELGLPATRRLVTGRVERVVTAAAQDADYVIVGRDGDRSRLGPDSLGRHTRFVVDHAPCAVMLIWPETAPSLGSIPPPPPRHQRPSEA